MHSGTKLRTPIQKFAVLCIGAIVLVVAAFSLRPHISNRSKPSTQVLIRTEAQASELSLAPVSPDSTVANRALFPYSVIPGGVNSALDLDNAVRNDPTVAAHYGDFNLTKAHIALVEQDRFVYVSYRIANHIFWTSKKLALSKGETLITDGTHEARTRCGNRISERPLSPVLKEEPSAAMLGRVPEALPSTNRPDSDGGMNHPRYPIAASDFRRVASQGFDFIFQFVSHGEFEYSRQR